MPANTSWVVVPAAGSGRRMAAAKPKQYLHVGGRPVIEHTLERLFAHPRVCGAVVVIAPDDPHWKTIRPAGHKPVLTAAGGGERCQSVLNGVRAVAARSAGDDWVLVHDAARPCLRAGDLDRLFDELDGHPVGGLLGTPVRDTIKRVDSGSQVESTVDRNSLWCALTPQMFRVQMLLDALESADARGAVVTDEAQAIELTGARPQMVQGHPDNIKITTPADLALAERFLCAESDDESAAVGTA